MILHALPLYHCAQLDVFLGPAVYVGATNVITASPTPDNLLPLIAEHRITSFFAPPTVWIALLRSPLFDQPDHSVAAQGLLRRVDHAGGGAAGDAAPRLPEVRLWNLYGQTEIAPLATVLRPDDQLRKPGSCGRPALNVETRVVDDRMNDVAPGEVGEIVHRSPQLLLGLLRRPRADTRPRSRAAGSTAATSRPSTTRATSPSSTARRT